MPVTAGALITSVCINGSVGIACFSLFAVLRQWRVTAKLYKPKRYIGAENVSGHKPAPLAAELPAGLLSWIKTVWCYKEPEVIDLCGLDVAVFFRVLQLGVRLFTFISLWCLLLVMPVNLMGGYLESHKKREPVGQAAATGPWAPAGETAGQRSWLMLPLFSLLSTMQAPDSPANLPALDKPYSSSNTSSVGGSIGSAYSGLGFGANGRVSEHVGLGNFSDVIHTNLDLLTLSNVAPGSRMMWVHLASVYVITLVALKLLWDLSRDVSFKRAVFLAVQGHSGPGSSVLVTDLPGLEWGTPLNRLQLSWLKWVLPSSLFRRGFDQPSPPQQSRQYLLAHGQQQQQQQQQHAEGDLRQPLLLEGEQGEAAHRAVEAAAAAALQGSVGTGHAAASSSSSFAGSVLVEVTSKGAAAAAAGSTNAAGGGSSSTDDDGRRHDSNSSDAAGLVGSSSSSIRWHGVGPPVVQNVWAEAVEVLKSNGGDVKAMVGGEMRRVYGAESMAGLVVVHDTSALDAAAAAYFKLQEQFEDVLDWYQYRLPPRPQEGDAEAPCCEQPAPQQQGGGSGQVASYKSDAKHKQLKRKMVLVVGPRHGSWGVDRYGMAPCQVDALEFYPAVLAQRLKEITALQQAALHSLPRPAAVVTFRRQLVATLAAASLHSYDETAWSVSPAPAPDELEWSHLGFRSWEVAVRQLAVWGAFWALVLFYAPVVALIQAPVNMDNLRKILPAFLQPLLQLPLVKSLIQGFLPSLVLLAFLAVLPMLLQALISRGGLHSITAADAQLTLMYFLFQLFAVFIFSFVSGTALSQLQALLDDPKRIVSLLGVSAPQQASFFSTYILLLGLSRQPIQLLRLPQLALYLLRLQLADSPRQRRRLWANQQQLLGYVLPLHTLVLLLGLVFCVASPLIAPFTLLYFVSSSVCQRYQWLYVYRHPYEGAGTLWKQVFTQVVVCVYFFVAVMGCLLGIKRFEAALLLVPLAVGVLVFHVLAGRLLERPLTLAPSREAAAMDTYTLKQQQQQQQHGSSTGNHGDCGAGSSSSSEIGVSKAVAQHAGLPDQVGPSPADITQDELQQLYMPPCMKLSTASLQPLLEEARDIQMRLEAAGY